MILPSTAQASDAPPSTAGFLEFQAAHRPDAIALLVNGRRVTFARFHRDLQKFTVALAAIGLPRGSLVAIACDQFYIHWQLLLAWESLGVATASFGMLESPKDLSPLLGRSQLVMSTHELPERVSARYHKLSMDWIEAVFALDAASLSPSDREHETGVGMNEPLRVRRSSGTTGGPKMMVVTRNMEEHLVGNQMLNLGLTPQSRMLIAGHFAVASMYSRATACLRLGATCISENRFGMAQAIVQHRASHVKLFQFQLSQLLEALGARKPPGLTVILGAAPLSDVLRAKVLRQLASTLVYTYNSNELGFMAVVGAAGVATLRPDVNAEVVDERGAPVPEGQSGQARVKSPAMVDGYLDNPEATARNFRDGWFYTGDAAIMVGPRRLRIIGRSDDLLNIGGIKVSPDAIEEDVAGRPGVVDVGVTSITNLDGVDEIGVAVVLAEGADFDEVRKRIAGRLAKSAGKARIVSTRKIPRTAESGKTQRALLKELFSGK